MIFFSKPEIGWREIWEVVKTLRSGWLTTGKITRKFEQEFADYVGSKYAVATSSCTVALELALRYIGIKKDDAVIVPSFTFCATAQAVENCGGRVIFGDIELENLTLDSDSLVVMSTLKMAKAIIPVHLGGNEAYTGYKIPVIEDSAHRIQRGQCKDNPNLVCFSFYPTKNMTTGEGGMIATNDEKAYRWLLQARSHGRTKLIGSGYDVLFTGLKANLPDILSAIGRVQLRKLDKINARRDEIVEMYNNGFKLQGKGRWKGNHLYPIFRKNRTDFMVYMKENGVQCSAHFDPLHKMTAWKDKIKYKLFNTELIGGTEISLPLYPSLKNKEVKRIIKLVNDYD